MMPHDEEFDESVSSLEMCGARHQKSWDQFTSISDSLSWKMFQQLQLQFFIQTRGTSPLHAHETFNALCKSHFHTSSTNFTTRFYKNNSFAGNGMSPYQGVTFLSRICICWWPVHWGTWLLSWKTMSVVTGDITQKLNSRLLHLQPWGTRTNLMLFSENPNTALLWTTNTPVKKRC